MGGGGGGLGLEIVLAGLVRTHLETPHELIGAQVVVDGLAADRVDNLAAHRWLGCVVLEGDSINSIEWNGMSGDSLGVCGDGECRDGISKHPGGVSQGALTSSLRTTPSSFYISPLPVAIYDGPVSTGGIQRVAGTSWGSYAGVALSRCSINTCK